MWAKAMVLGGGGKNPAEGTRTGEVEKKKVCRYETGCLHYDYCRTTSYGSFAEIPTSGDHGQKFKAIFLFGTYSHYGGPYVYVGG